MGNSMLLYLTLVTLISALNINYAFSDPSYEHESNILENKIPKGTKRYDTFLKALTLMKKRNAKVIVETGTSRNGKMNCLGDGCSTFIFGEWASENNARVYSVDINEQALLNAKKELGTLEEFVQLIQNDSIEFLRNFNQYIDFLYLDSYDFDSSDPNPSQQHHLKEIIAVYPWLTKNSIVMIDDCHLPYGGKGRLVINFLLQRGWKIVAKGYQVILIQG